MTSRAMRAAISASGLPRRGRGSTNRAPSSAAVAGVDTGPVPCRVAARYSAASATNRCAASSVVSDSISCRIGSDTAIRDAKYRTAASDDGLLTARRTSAQFELEQLLRRLGLSREIDLEAVEDHRVVDALGEEGAGGVGRELGVEAERHVRGEGVARPGEAEAAAGDGVVELTQWPVRVEREHDDVRLHEAVRLLDAQL